MKQAVCAQCPIYNDGLLQLGVRKHCKVLPRLIPNPGKPRLLFFGEAPGENEDIENQAFVGRAGRQFDKLLTEAGLIDFDIRIANIVKCRPIKFENTKYKNRAPIDQEVEVCAYYLDEDWAFEPDLVITLGRVPTRALFPEMNPSDIRGRAQRLKKENKDYLVLPTYHPAATLYDPTTKPVLFRHLKNSAEYLRGIGDKNG
jgi:DNA polymerase